MSDADSLARKAAQQVAEFLTRHCTGMDDHDAENCSKCADMELGIDEIVELALAPMREALQAVLETRFVRIKPKLFGCQECREMGPTIEAIKHVSECVVARAAEVLKHEK